MNTRTTSRSRRGSRRACAGVAMLLALSAFTPERAPAAWNRPFDKESFEELFLRVYERSREPWKHSGPSGLGELSLRAVEPSRNGRYHPFAGWVGDILTVYQASDDKARPFLCLTYRLWEYAGPATANNGRKGGDRYVAINASTASRMPENDPNREAGFPRTAQKAEAMFPRIAAGRTTTLKYFERGRILYPKMVYENYAPSGFTTRLAIDPRKSIALTLYMYPDGPILPLRFLDSRSAHQPAYASALSISYNPLWQDSRRLEAHSENP